MGDEWVYTMLFILKTCIFIQFVDVCVKIFCFCGVILGFYYRDYLPFTSFWNFIYYAIVFISFNLIWIIVSFLLLANET